MYITAKDIIEYVLNTPNNTNPEILKELLVEFAGSDNPDLSFITAEADKILKDYVGVDTQANKVIGTCTFNTEVPAKALDDIDYGTQPGQYFLSRVDGEWVLRQVGDQCVVDGVSYNTIADAFDSVESGSEIILENDGETAGLGLWEAAEKDITLDLNGHELTVIGPAVGSAGTKTQAAHFEKGSKVVIKNGTISAASVDISNVKMVIQNYADLTLENVVLDFHDNNAISYVVSNNFGSLTVKGNTQIIAAPGKCAFDLWFGLDNRGSYDDGVNVHFDDSFTGRIVGNVEYGAQNATRVPEWIERTKLVIKGNGTFDGPIVRSSSNFDLADANVEVYGGTFTSDTWDQFRK